ncbi:TPA: hypothetical protein ACG5KU_001324 [Streptococcus agalactiae]
MEALNFKIRAMVMGLSDFIDYETKEKIGVTLDIGYRNQNGKFQTQNVKILGASLNDFSEYLDTIATITLADVTIVSYLNNNRAALSIKAQSATVESIEDL